MAFLKCQFARLAIGFVWFLGKARTHAHAHETNQNRPTPRLSNPFLLNYRSEPLAEKYIYAIIEIGSKVGRAVFYRCPVARWLGVQRANV